MIESYILKIDEAVRLNGDTNLLSNQGSFKKTLMVLMTTSVFLNWVFFLLFRVLLHLQGYVTSNPGILIFLYRYIGIYKIQFKPNV